jgi:RecA/RadA recombinase
MMGLKKAIPFDSWDLVEPQKPQASCSVRGMSLFFPDDPLHADTEWIIDGLIARRALTVIAGAPGSGKSIAVLSALAAAQAERRWLGREVDAGPTLWLAFEAVGSTRTRLAALDPARETQVCVASSPPRLLDRGALDMIDAAIDQTEDHFGRPVEIVVVDALAAAMRGGDENSGRDVGAALGVLLKLVEQRDVAVIVIAHTGKGDDDGPRGHSSISADATSVLSIVGSGPIKRLRTRKQRDGKPLPDISFRVIERDGALDVTLAEDSGAETPRQDRLTPDCTTVLDVIRKFGKPVPFKQARDECFDALRMGKGGKPRGHGAIKQAFSAAMKLLTERGLINNDGVSVRMRQDGVSTDASASSGSVRKKRQHRPLYRGGADDPDAPARRMLMEAAQ